MIFRGLRCVAEFELMGCWKLYAYDRVRRLNLVVGLFSSRESAIDFAQRLWKRQQTPRRIVGPSGEIVAKAEIEEFGRAHPEFAD